MKKLSHFPNSNIEIHNVLSLLFMNVPNKLFTIFFWDKRSKSVRYVLVNSVNNDKGSDMFPPNK